jgi:hypothetical protein
LSSSSVFAGKESYISFSVGIILKEAISYKIEKNSKEFAGILALNIGS